MQENNRYVFFVCLHPDLVMTDHSEVQRPSDPLFKIECTTMKKVFVSFAVLALALASCQGKSAEGQTDSIAQDSTVVAEQPAAANEGVYGTYEGTIPGADTSIKTTITLNADGTYTKHEEFSKEGAQPMDESGLYRLEGDLLTLVTPSSNLETYYKVSEGKITLLDQATKELPTGELAAQYDLAKK